VRSLVLLLPVAVLLVLFGAGCGGIDKGKLESAIKSQTNTQLERAGRSERVSTVSCVKTSDSYHYTCDLENDAGTTFLTVKATCTTKGTCRWGKQ
jgi:hypothetical protein